MFGQRLLEAVRRKRTPLMVGLDPRWSSLPAWLREPAPSGDPDKVIAAVRAFCHGVIEVAAPLVPAIKPQAAFFEALGPPGMQLLQEVLQTARAQELITVLDGKRNDIGSTADGYARAYVQGPASPFSADAVTVNPYLGEDGLWPFLDAARPHGAGIFVLVKTSNPSSGQFQDLQAEGKPVYRHVAEVVERLSAAGADGANWGPVGAVVGATYPEQLSELRQVLAHCWLLVPGYGAQGGKPADVAPAFRGDGTGALINSARAILEAPNSPRFGSRYPAQQWQRAVEDAIRCTIEDLRSATNAGRL